MRKCIHLEALLVCMYDDITLGVFMEMPPFIMVSFRIARLLAIVLSYSPLWAHIYSRRSKVIVKMTQYIYPCPERT